MLAATVVVAAVVARVVILGLGDTSETESPARRLSLRHSPQLDANCRRHAAASDAHAVRTAVNASSRCDAGRDAAAHHYAAGYADEAAGPGDGARAQGGRQDGDPAAAAIAVHRPRRQDGRAVRHARPGRRRASGRGQSPVNAFGQDRFAYIDASGEAWLVELPAFNQTSLGKAPGVSFVDRYRLMLGSGPQRHALRHPHGRFDAVLVATQAERRRFGRTSQIDARLTSRPASASVAARSMLATTRVGTSAASRNALLGRARRRTTSSRTRAARSSTASAPCVWRRPGQADCSLRRRPCVPPTGSRCCARALPPSWGDKDIPYDDPEFATGTTNLYLVDFAQGTTQVRRDRALQRRYLTTRTGRSQPTPTTSSGRTTIARRLAARRAFTTARPARSPSLTARTGSPCATASWALANSARGPSSTRHTAVLAVLPQVSGDVRGRPTIATPRSAAPQGHGGLCRVIV